MAVLAERYGRACQNSPDVVDLEPLWNHFGALGVHFEFTLAQVGRSWCQFDLKLAQYGPKFAKVGPKMAANLYLGALWVHFGVTLESLWVTLGTLGDHFGMTLSIVGTVLTDFGISLS